MTEKPITNQAFISMSSGNLKEPAVKSTTPVFSENNSRSPWFERKRRFSDAMAERVIKATAFISLAFIGLIIFFIFKEALPVFQSTETGRDHQDSTVVVEQQETYGDDISGVSESMGAVEDRAGQMTMMDYKDEVTIRGLFTEIWQPISEQPKYGLLPLFAGTAKITILGVLIAAPIAILSALFTAMFAPKWAKEILKPCIEILAGIPSVVIGFFALIVLASLIQNFFGFEYRLNAFVGGLAMSLAVIPIIYTITEDSLTAIPKTYMEASLALGVSKWQTALFVILPAATPGIFAAILLGVGRAFGETMIVLMATGNAALLSWNIFEPVRTMSATIGSEMAEVVFGEPHYHVLFLIGAILFVFTFTLNAVAELWVRKFLLKKFRGS